MRPTLELDVRHSGNLGGERRAMTLDETAIAHLMSVLTDLYSDPAEAVIRETSTNAADSHKAAGNPDPIEVTLPTRLDPVFTVRDRGVGMSRDTILENYSKYGWSSKRDNDDEVGMLGLGCKAPLTYTSQFSVTAVKDGVMCTVLVSRGTDGIGGVEVVDESPTDEPNGVTVQVPVNKVEEFRAKAMNFFSFWEHGSVLVDGEEPPHRDGDYFDPDVMFVEGIRTDYIVMGNVPYPVDAHNRLWREGYSGSVGFIVRVPVGSVNFTPSREALHYTPLTLETLETARKFILDTFHRRAQADVDDAKNGTEAVERAIKWRNRIIYQRRNDLKLYYRGVLIPWYVHVDSKFRYFCQDNQASPRDSYTTLEAWNLLDYGFVHGHPTKTFTPLQRQKFRQYRREHDIKKNTWEFLPNLDGLGIWLEGAGNVIAWEDIDKQVIEKDTASSKAKEEFTFLVNGARRTMTVTDFPTDKPVMLMTPAGIDDWRFEFHTLLEDFHVLLIHPRSWKRLKREHPTALDAPDAIEKAVKDFYARLTPAHMATLSGTASAELRALVHLNTKRVLDPVLAKALANMAEVERENLNGKLRNLDRIWRRVRPGEPFPEYKFDPASFTNLMESYPLLLGLNRYAKAKHVIEYVNALYQTRRAAAAEEEDAA